MKPSGVGDRLTFNQLKILYYIRSVKQFAGSQNQLQELVNIEGGSFDVAFDKLKGKYLEEVREDNRVVLKVTKEGDKAVRFLRVPNYVLASMYSVGVGLVVLGFLITHTPMDLRWYIPVAVMAFGFLSIGGALGSLFYARTYAKEFLRIRDKPSMTV
jgi:hypothetical protein